MPRVITNASCFVLKSFSWLFKISSQKTYEEEKKRYRMWNQRSRVLLTRVQSCVSRDCNSESPAASRFYAIQLVSRVPFCFKVLIFPLEKKTKGEWMKLWELEMYLMMVHFEGNSLACFLQVTFVWWASFQLLQLLSSEKPKLILAIIFIFLEETGSHFLQTIKALEIDFA